MVILTSFKLVRKISSLINIDKIYSVARWQPKGFHYRTLHIFQPFDINGNPLKLRNYKENPLKEYKNDYIHSLMEDWDNIEKWLNNLDNNTNIALLCWCPYSEPSKLQIKEYGTFCCHNGIIGQIINKHRPDITVCLDVDRDNALVEEWKPDNYIVIDENNNDTMSRQKYIF